MSVVYLFASTDKLRISTSSAAAIKVHGNYVESVILTGAPASYGIIKNSISSATDTDVLVGPGGSTNFRAPKGLTVRNGDASLACDVTVSFNDNGTIYEKVKVTLNPGETLEYEEGIGFFKVAASTARSGMRNVSTADQSIGASATAYVTGSAILLPASPTLVAGMVLRWFIQLGKSAAGVAATSPQIRFGTGGSTSDTARCTFTGDAETAAADEAIDIITATIRGPIGASCIVQSSWKRDTNLSTTGFSNTARKALVQAIQSAAFDVTPAGTIAGIVYTTGASEAITVRQVVGELLNIGA